MGPAKQYLISVDRYNLENLEIFFHHQCNNSMFISDVISAHIRFKHLMSVCGYFSQICGFDALITSTDIYACNLQNSLTLPFYDL